MTKPKLHVVASVAATPAPAKPGKQFKIPLLTEMTPEEQKSFILEAHDAVLAHPLTLPNWSPSEVGLTVAEGLKVALKNIITPPDAHDNEAFRITEALRYLGVSVLPPRERRLEKLDERIQAGEEISEREKYEAWLVHSKTIKGPHAVVGESATPLGYIVSMGKGFKAEQLARKPLEKYYDLFPLRGFPLYSPSYRHLIDIAEVLEHYKGYRAQGERLKYEARQKQAAVRKLTDEAPEVVRLRAHNQILSSPVGHHTKTTIREALMKARTEEDYTERRMWRTYLQNAGIELQMEGASCAGVVVHPEHLISMNRLELTPYKKLLGGTVDGAREVRFELVV